MAAAAATDTKSDGDVKGGAAAAAEKGGSAKAESAAASSVVANDPASISPDIIDMDIFAQLLEMDDEDEQFSKEIVWNYFEQAATTFDKMDTAL